MRHQKQWIVSVCFMMAFFCSGAVPLMASAAGSQVESWADWEEDYTDTDMRKGVLAVRCDAFEGFHGNVRLLLKEAQGGLELSVNLTPESDYLVNVSLGLGIYQVETVSASSDGREFDCSAEPEELSIQDNLTAMCRVKVVPDSLYRVPYENPETEETGNLNKEDEQKIPEESIAQEPERQAEAKQGFSILMVFSLIFAAMGLGGILYVITRKKEG